MSNKTKQIDLLDRNSLIQLCKKLQIPGYSNNFNKPYKNKSELKTIIIKYIKEHKKLKRSNSVSNSQPSVSGNHNQTNQNYENSNAKLHRSKSLNNINSRDNLNIQTDRSNISNLTNNINTCVFPKVRKLVAIGDIHGDMSVAIKALKLAGVIPLSISDNTNDIN